MKHILWDGAPATAQQIYQALRHAIAANARGQAAETLYTGRSELPDDARWALAYAPEAVALIVGTSGSTGTPKYVCLSLAALQASAAATQGFLAHFTSPLTARSKWLFTLPADHIAGLQILFRSALADTVPVFMDQRESFTPAAFNEAARQVFAGSVSTATHTSLVPTQLTRLLANVPDIASENLGALDPTTAQSLTYLRAFTSVLVGGAATPPYLLHKSRDLGINVVTTYGSSETSGGCVYNSVPLPGVQVRSPGRRIHVAGSMLLTGYIAQTPEGHFGFVDPCIHEPERWLPTNDMGEMLPSGALRIDGRLDDVIISGGTNVAPQPIEALIAGFDWAPEVVVVGVPDEQWGQRVVAVVGGTQAPPGAEIAALLSGVRRHCLDILDAASAPHDLVFLPELPLLPSGKVDRTAARALALENLA